MPSIPLAASSSVAYLTKPNPFEYPDTRSVTTLAVSCRNVHCNEYEIHIYIYIYNIGLKMIFVLIKIFLEQLNECAAEMV